MNLPPSLVGSRRSDTPPRKKLCVSPTGASGSCVKWKEEDVCQFFSSRGLSDAGKIMQGE